MKLGEALDVRLVNNRVTPRGIGGLIISPVKAGIRQNRFRNVRCGVFCIKSKIIVADVTIDSGIQYELTINGFGVGVNQ